VVEEVADGLATVAGVHGGVGEFLEIFNARLRVGRVLGLKKLDVLGAVDEELETSAVETFLCGLDGGGFASRASGENSMVSASGASPKSLTSKLSSASVNASLPAAGARSPNQSRAGSRVRVPAQGR